MAILLDGKKLSEKIRENLAEQIKNLARKPHLAVILVGEDPASQLYVGIKEKTVAKLGMKSSVFKYPKETTENVILNKINDLNEDKLVDAILVQLPLPKHIDTKKIIQSISPQKDVDGFSPINIGNIFIGEKPTAYPCTPKGIITLINEYKIDISGKHAVVVGRSNIVGKPLAQMLLNKNATVTICHSKTENLAEITKTADILISAVGFPKLITREMIKPNCVIIDVGTSKINGKLSGDVDFENVFDLVSYITPVPGGVGPMTIATLMTNTFDLYNNNSN